MSYHEEPDDDWEDDPQWNYCVECRLYFASELSYQDHVRYHANQYILEQFRKNRLKETK